MQPTKTRNNSKINELLLDNFFCTFLSVYLFPFLLQMTYFLFFFEKKKIISNLTNFCSPKSTMKYLSWSLLSIIYKFSFYVKQFILCYINSFFFHLLLSGERMAPDKSFPFLFPTAYREYIYKGYIDLTL